MEEIIYDETTQKLLNSNNLMITLVYDKYKVLTERIEKSTIVPSEDELVRIKKAMQKELEPYIRNQEDILKNAIIKARIVPAGKYELLKKAGVMHGPCE